MSNVRLHRSVFLSIPVSDSLAGDGTFRPERREFYENVIIGLKALQLDVECAALNEDWGRIKLPPVQFTNFDVKAIERSDLLVLVTSERLTRDMYLEIGMATALKLPVFLFIPASTHLTFMMEGLKEIGKVEVVRYDAESEVPKLIQDTLCRDLTSLEGEQP